MPHARKVTRRAMATPMRWQAHPCAWLIEPTEVTVVQPFEGTIERTVGLRGCIDIAWEGPARTTSATGSRG